MVAMVAAIAAAQLGNAVAQFGGTVAAPATPAAPVGIAQAYIDLETGEIVLDIGGGLQVFGIETLNTTGFFDNAAATAAPNGLQAIDPPPPFPVGATQGPGTQNDADGIGVLNVGFLPAGEFDLGNIIAAGLTQQAILTDAGFNLRFNGPGNTNPDNAVAAPSNVFLVGSAIPEPGSLTIHMFAGEATAFAASGLPGPSNRRLKPAVTRSAVAKPVGIMLPKLNKPVGKKPVFKTPMPPS